MMVALASLYSASAPAASNIAVAAAVRCKVLLDRCEEALCNDDPAWRHPGKLGSTSASSAVIAAKEASAASKAGSSLCKAALAAWSKLPTAAMKNLSRESRLFAAALQLSTMARVRCAMTAKDRMPYTA